MKSFLSCVLPAVVWACAVLPAWAQNPVTKIWDKRFGGSGWDQAKAIVAAPGGGYVIAGSSNSGATGDKSQPSQGNADYWVVKVDENGNKLWDRRFGGSSSDECNAIVAAPGGGYVLAGSSSSNASGDKSQNTRGAYDYWIVKIDENGNKIWDRRFGGTSQDLARGIVAAPGGGYTVVGYSGSNAGGDKTQNSRGGNDYWVVKVDENGNKLWDKRFGGSSSDEATSIVNASDGGYILSGDTWSAGTGDNTLSFHVRDDFWIVKIDENGNKIWDRQANYSTGNDIASCLVISPNGGYIVGGHNYAHSSITLPPGNNGAPTGENYCLVKVNADGITVWQKSLGGQFQDSTTNVIAAPGGGYIVVGKSNSNMGLDKTENVVGGYDYWIVKLDDNGNIVWNKQFGGTANDVPHALVATNDGQYVVVGKSNSGIGGDKSESSQGSDDYWVIRFKDCLGDSLVFTLQNSTNELICPNTPVTLSIASDSAYTYTWQPGNLTGTSLVFTPTQTTVYTVTAQSAGGCLASQTVTVQVAQTVSQTVNLAMNFGDTLTLDAGPGLEYRWVATGQTTQAIQITEPGTYFVSVDYGACAQRIRYVVDTLSVMSGVSGKVYYDENENGQYDAGESPIANRPVSLLQPSGTWVSTTTTDSTGFYWAPWPAAGSYRVKIQELGGQIPILQPNLQGEYTETITTVAEVRTERDFGFKKLQDVSVSITPVGFFRSGFNYRVRVQYCNNSAVKTYSGEITVALAPILGYTGQTVFPYANLQPDECRTFDLVGTVPAMTAWGTPVAGAVTITPLTDDKPENNTDNFTGVIQGAYDPNDKTAFIEARTSGDYALEGETIEYLIRFQNTGTDTAFTVVVRDTLDYEKLDLTTIELITTSHPAQFTLRGTGIAVWQFANILLPDSNTNEPLSHGFIRFRAKTRTGLGCDAVTSNRVSIFFDFNDPIVTNNAVTTINVTPQAAIAASSNVPLSPNNPQVELTGTGTPDATGVSYLWSTGATTPTLTVTAAGTYTLTTTGFAGCSSTASLAVNALANTLTIATQANPAVCSQIPTGSASVQAVAGYPPYSYQWSDGVITPERTGLIAGTYTVLVVDEEGFSQSATIEVQGGLHPVATVLAVPVLCTGGSTGSATITVSSGTAPYSYAWSTGATTSTLPNVSAGTYQAVVTDANGCSTSVSTTISEPMAPMTVTASAEKLCPGLNAAAGLAVGSGGTPPYTYLWSTGLTAASVNNLPGGTHTVTVTDVNGCSAQTDVTVAFHPAIQIEAAVVPTGCQGTTGGSISLTVSGGTPPFSYQWNNGATTQNLTNVPAGSYFVTVQDAAGCYQTKTIGLTNGSNLIALGSVTEALCSGSGLGSASVAVSGGVPPFSYLWSTGSTAAALDGLPVGSYSVTVTDAQGCVASGTAIVQPANPPVASAVATNVACRGAATGSVNLTVSGGSVPYSYVWSTGSTASSLTNLPAGTYSATITDANGCSTSANAVVSQPATVLEATTTIQHVSSCATADGQVIIGASGGVAPYGFVWNTGSTDQFISSVQAGVYTVTITDANSCTIQRTAEVKCATSRGEALASGFTLSPNPTTGQFVVRFPQPMTGPVRVYDAVGKLLHSHEATHTTELPLDLSTQPAGVYFVQALGQTAKVVLAR